MAWIKFQEAVTRAKVSVDTGRRRIKDLKKYDPVLFKKLVKPGRPMLVKDREIVAFFKTDIANFKKRMDAKILKSKPGRKKRVPATPGMPKEIREMVLRTVSEPIVLNIEPKLEAIYKGIVSQHDKNIFIISVKICHDYLMGYDTIQQCAQQNGIDARTFFTWRQQSPELSFLFKKARIRRNKILADRDTEDAINVIRKLMHGYTVEEKSRKFRIVTGISGKEVLIPDSIETKERNFQPHFGAAVFMAANRDPENWKRNTPLDELLKKKELPEDIFDKMSQAELDEYIANAEKKMEE